MFFLIIALIMLVGGALATLFPALLPGPVLGCLVTKGKKRSCGMTVGGLDELYLGNWADIDPAFSSTATNFAADGSIATLQLQLGKKIFPFDFETNTAGFSQELQVGVNRYLNLTANFTLKGYDQAHKNLAETLATGKVFLIARTRGSGKFFALGLPNKDGKGTYLQATAITGGSGQAEADLDGLAYTLSGPQTFFANQIDRAAFAAHIDTVNVV